jgi:capsular polysaccharide biosynthesis protein
MLSSLVSAIDALAPRMDSAAKEAIDVNELTLIVHNEGGGTWGHWIVQNLPRVILFKQKYPDAKIALPEGYRGGNFAFSLSLFGIEWNSVFPLNHAKSYRFKQAAFIDHLYDLDGVVHPAAIDVLSQAIIPDAEEFTPPRIFIERSKSVMRRNIENISEITDVAKSFGFSYGKLGRVPVTKQASYWREGTHFCSILGSDLTNIVFAKPGENVISITPEIHGDNFFLDLAAAKGLVWNEMLCGQLATRREPIGHSSFEVDPRIFHEFLKQATAVA